MGLLVRGFALVVVALVWALPARAIEVQRVVSPGGIEAWLVEAHAVPILSLEAWFRGGAALDPPGKAGRASMATALLDEGAGDLTSEAFQTRLADRAIRLSFDAGRDTVGASLKTLSANTDEAFDLLRLALTAPRFDEEPMARVRRQILAVLARDDDDPDATASRTWYAAAFPDHPYGIPVDGTPESVAALGADDLRAFVREQLARDRLVIGVVGDITPERLAPLLDATFGALPARGTTRTVADTTPSAVGRTLVIERDIPQSVVVFGKAGIARNDPDYYAAYVMNHILGGGGFGSRLTTEVREKRGLAYGVYTYLAPLAHAPLLMGGVATANERVAESIALVRAEFERLRNDGATAAELADAKTYLTGSFPLRLDSNDRIADMLAAIQFYDLGIDYLDRRNALIEAVTLDDVNRAARRLLDAKALEVVVVGKPVGLTTTP